MQRVGDNETVKVDVRIVAATHRPLAQHAQTGSFRSDLYYRLAVFLIRTPALAEHARILPLLVDHFLEQMGRDAPVKRIDEAGAGQTGRARLAGQRPRTRTRAGAGVILAGDNSGADLRRRLTLASR